MGAGVEISADVKNPSTGKNYSQPYFVASLMIIVTWTLTPNETKI